MDFMLSAPTRLGMVLASITFRKQQKVGEHHAQRYTIAGNPDSNLKSDRRVRLFGR